MTKDEIRKTFLEQVGSVIKKKRLQKNISLEQLGVFLDVSTSTISRYETGNTEIPVSSLPLISGYCGFPVRDYLPNEIDKLMETFSKLAQFKGERYRRSKVEKSSVKYPFLKAKVYEKDGIEYTEPVKEQIESKSLRKHYMDCEEAVHGVKPFNQDEFLQYIGTMQRNGHPASEILSTAGDMLDYLEGTSNRNRFRNTVADYIIGELIIEPLMNKGDEASLRAYAYYRELFGATSFEENPVNELL